MYKPTYISNLPIAAKLAGPAGVQPRPATRAPLPTLPWPTSCRTHRGGGSHPVVDIRSG
eukprot:COSAG01_NODE_61498_length_289_cov_0.815789_1_plen_58_part_10